MAIESFLPAYDLSKVPAKTGDQTNEEFMEYADYFVDYITENISTLESMRVEANILADDCNNASVTCLAGSRFRGLWTALTGSGAIGDSVWHLSKFWILVTATSNIVSDVPGTSTKWKAWSIPIDTVNTLATYTPSSAAVVDITSVITSAYNMYEIQMYNIIPATDAATFLLYSSADNGSTWDTTAGQYDWYNETPSGVSTPSDAELRPIGTNTVGSDVGEYGITGTIKLYAPGSSGQNKTFSWRMSYVNTSGVLYAVTGFGRRLSTSALNALRFSFSSGNIESGTIIVRGHR